MFHATSHRMIKYQLLHFALIRVIDVQPNTTYFPNFFSSLLITVFPKVHEKKCSTYTPSHCGATAAPSALCDIRLFLPGRNRYYDSVLSASHSSNDVKHTCEVRCYLARCFTNKAHSCRQTRPPWRISHLMSVWAMRACLSEDLLASP
jgi:hypothetical protein